MSEKTKILCKSLLNLLILCERLISLFNYSYYERYVYLCTETTHWLENDAEFELKKLVWKTIHLKNTSKKKLQVLIINFDNLSNVPYSGLVWVIFQSGEKKWIPISIQSVFFCCWSISISQRPRLATRVQTFQVIFCFPKKLPTKAVRFAGIQSGFVLFKYKKA